MVYGSITANVKISVFVICVEASIRFLSYHLHDCTLREFSRDNEIQLILSF